MLRWPKMAVIASVDAEKSRPSAPESVEISAVECSPTFINVIDVEESRKAPDFGYFPTAPGLGKRAGGRFRATRFRRSHERIFTSISDQRHFLMIQCGYENPRTEESESKEEIDQ